MILETKVGLPVVLAGTTLAVIDPSLTSVVLAVIAAVVVFIPIWFKYKTDAQNLKIAAFDVVVKEQNLKIKELTDTIGVLKQDIIKITGEKDKAIGKAEGLAEAEAKADVIAIAKAAGVAEAKAAEKPVP